MSPNDCRVLLIDYKNSLINSRMSLLTNQISINGDRFFFISADAKFINVSTLTGNNITALSGSISSLNTNFLSSALFLGSTVTATEVRLDNQTLNATASELLLNGVPIATLSNLSSIADWSYDPAVSTVVMNNNNLLGANQISTVSIVAQNGVFTNLIGQNTFFVNTTVSTISSLIEVANLGLFSTLNAGSMSTATLGATSISTVNLQATTGVLSNLQVGVMSTVTTGLFTTLQTNTLSTGVVNAGQIYLSDFITSPTGGFTSTLSASTFTTRAVGAIGTSLLIDANNVLNAKANNLMTFTVDSGANVTNNPKIGLTATNGLQPQIALTADTGFAGLGGRVDILARGGVTPLGLGYGGEINLTATTGTFTSLSLTSAVNLSGAGINSYAGVTPPIGSIAGGNFLHGDSIVNITAGVPPIFSDPLCVYLRGTNGILLDSETYVQGPIRPYSDLVQNPVDLFIEDYDNGITHGYIQLRGVSTATFTDGGSIEGLPVISMVAGQIKNVSTINSQPYNIVTSAFNSTIITSVLDVAATPVVIASTLIHNYQSSFVAVNANVTLLNTDNSAYHNNSLYVTIDGVASQSTVTTAIKKSGTYMGQNVSFRSYIGPGDYTVVLEGYSDTPSVIHVTQGSLSATAGLL